MLRRNQNLNNKFKIRATRTNRKDEQGNEAKGYLYKEIRVSLFSRSRRQEGESQLVKQRPGQGPMVPTGKQT